MQALDYHHQQYLRNGSLGAVNTIQILMCGANTRFGEQEGNNWKAEFGYHNYIWQKSLKHQTPLF